MLLPTDRFAKINASFRRRSRARRGDCRGGSNFILYFSQPPRTANRFLIISAEFAPTY